VRGSGVRNETGKTRAVGEARRDLGWVGGWSRVAWRGVASGVKIGWDGMRWL